MLIQLDEEGFIFSICSIPSKKDFINIYKVSNNGYACNILERIYADLFIQSLNLSYEYSTYYHKDYSSINELLKNKYGIECEKIKTKENEHILLVSPSNLLITNYYEESALAQIMAPLGVSHEN